MPKQRKPRTKVNQRMNQGQVYAIDRNMMEQHRQRQIINELELLQRLPVTQEQLLHPNYHPSPLAYAIQAQMPQLAPPPVPPPPPARPEPSFRGMSREDFHLHVRNRLEDVAQAALNRTDGEREYQQKELMIKSRLRAAVQRKQTQQHQPCSVGASPTTPQTNATIFHTPSPSPTFRNYPPEPNAMAQLGYQHLIPQLNNNPVKFGAQANGQPYLIATNNPYQTCPNPVQILGQMKNQIILINNPPFPHHSHGSTTAAHHHHLAQNVQNIFTN